MLQSVMQRPSEMSENSVRSRLAVVSGLILLAGLLWAAVGENAQAQKSKAAAGAKAPVIVRAAAVKVVDFHDRVEALGTLRAKESVAVTATVTDTVSAIYFEDGQRVKKDQILVEMSAGEERAILAEIESTVAEAELQYNRTKRLAQRKLIAGSSLDERRRLLQTSKARLKAMNARLADRAIRAPFSGVVGLRTISVGALVEPGTVIVQIADDSQMKLDFSVPSTFIGSVAPGLTISAKTRGLGASVFRGKVTGIDNRVDPVTRTIRVRAVLPNEDRKLVPGLLMQIELLQNARKAKVIPEEAVVPIGNDSFVFVVAPETSTVMRRKIALGQRRFGEIEVLNGLETGDLVITHGTLKLRDGAPVKIDNKEFERITPQPEGRAAAQDEGTVKAEQTGGTGRL